MFNDQLNRAFILEAIAPAGIRAGDLTPYQLGLFDMDTNLSVDSASYCADKTYVFKYRTPSVGFETPFGGDERNAAIPIQTLPLGRIDKVHAFQEATDEPKPFIGYLGWDSVSACKNLAFECGKTYGLLIKAVGKNVIDVFGRNFEEIVSFTTDCCDDCSIAESSVSAVRKIVEAIEKESFYLNNSFFKAEMVYDCCPASDPFEKKEYRKYCLTLCDTGDSHALAQVQRAYPDLEVERTERDGVYSTYEVCKACVITTPDDPATPDTDETVWECTAPADYTTSGTRRVVCDTCPTGFTLVPGGISYVMELAYDGVDTDYLAVVQALYPDATFADLMSCTAGVGTFQVTMPGTFDGTQVADTKIRELGTAQDTCTEDTPQTFPWTECGTAYKITRKLCLTLKNEDCDNSDRLDEVIEAYANTPDIVQGSVAIRTQGNCNTVYEIEQCNNACLMDGCDTFGKDGAKFDRVPEFEGFVWMECDCEGWTFDGDGCPVPPTDPALQDCRAGVKFTGLFLDRENMVCRQTPHDQINVDPIRLEVTLIDQDAGDRCDTNIIPWTIVQEPTIAQGLSEFVFRQIIHSRQYDNHIFIDPDGEMGTLMQNRIGYDFGVKPNTLYHHFDLYHYSDSVRYVAKTDHKLREKICFFIEADNLALQDELKRFLNKTLLAQGACNLLA